MVKPGSPAASTASTVPVARRWLAFTCLSRIADDRLGEDHEDTSVQGMMMTSDWRSAEAQPLA